LLLEQRLKAALEKRQADALYRRRITVESAQDRELFVDNSTLLNFCSNDYLGLANDDRLKQASIDAIKKFGTGSGASHLVNGHSAIHQQFEQELADWLGYPRVLLFSTGFMANTAVLQTLVQKGDLVFQDKLNHASLIDGGLHCDGTLKRYRHNDMAHLCNLLTSTELSDNAQRFIVTDGVFSMDGDCAKISELLELSNVHDASLIIDDAHGFGVLGAQGKGCAEAFTGLIEPKPKPILVGTLGKAFGAFGAFVAASEATIEYLIQFARPYIYTTALPPAVAASGLAALDIIKNEPQRRQKLHHNINYFRQQASDNGIELMPSDTPIQPIKVGEAAKSLALSRFLKDNGVLVTAIRPPTVPQGTSRLRVTLTANHQLEDIDRLVVLLRQF